MDSTKTPPSIGTLLDHLNALQMGIVMECLKVNAEGMNEDSYYDLAEEVRRHIEADCGMEEYASVYEATAKRHAAETI